ncbi:MAG: hypothetical protein ABIY48_11250, partial [Acidimicrobiales bacterium]
IDRPEPVRTRAKASQNTRRPTDQKRPRRAAGAELHTTVGNTVSLAVRALRQDRVGADLIAPLRDDESAWLDADLG